ncbi:SDR family oxidoreductase [uncultured Aquimarina sp.]|uniref:SDR family oxidoreductase n=1 Tax=uncultured Aquimarina sp. TaxID=575652 RepID=UPI00261D082C|nr:SDR family oxidoreductase [uncultured Aquimarina sp.]
MISLKDKKVVIVGASSGIGKALAKLFIEKESIVYLVSRTESKLKQVQEEIGGITHVIPMDMLNEHSVNKAFSKIGKFDFLSFSAVSDETKLMSQIKDMDTEIAQRGMEKFWGTFNCCRAAANYINKGGSIVVTSSMAIYRPSKNGASIMNAASAAVNVFAKSLAREISPTRVNIIAPGVVKTGVWTENEKTNFSEWAKNTLPVEHLGTADELAYTYFNALTNPYMTGTTITVDGGLTLI